MSDISKPHIARSSGSVTIVETASPTPSSMSGGAGLHSSESSSPAVASLRRHLRRRDTATSRPRVDIAFVGDGLSSRYTAAFTLEIRLQVPADKRAERDDQGPLELATIAPNAANGGGRAYTLGRGYADNELINLLPRQQEFTPASTTPIDAELLKMTEDIEERRLAGKRPFDFGEDYVNPENGLHYSLRADRRNSYSLAEFNRTDNGADAQGNGADTQGVTRNTLGRYLVHCLGKAVGKSDDVRMTNVAGEAVAIDYDDRNELFELTIRNNIPGIPDFILEARNVVLAVGHHPDRIPEAVQAASPFDGACASDDTISDEAVYRFLGSVPEQAAVLADKRLLVQGTGLSMNDMAVCFHDHGVNDFLAVSRSGLTHELPQDVPAEDVRSIPGIESLLSIFHEVIDLSTIRNKVGHSVSASTITGRMALVDGMKGALDLGRELIDQYMLHYDEQGWDKTPMQIRGKSFERTRVIRALLSQYVAYRYEQLHGYELREQLGSPDAEALVALAYREIDSNPRYASWLTTSRTTTTDRNIEANRRMRESGQLKVDRVVSKHRLADGRSRVRFASGVTEIFDQVFNVTGRHPRPGVDKQLPDMPLIDSAVAAGLLQAEVAGVGVKTDDRGRAVPLPGHYAGNVPKLFPVAPSLSKWDAIFPKKRGLEPHNDTLGESSIALRPLARRAAEALVFNLYEWEPLAESDLEYSYGPNGVDPELRDF